MKEIIKNFIKKEIKNLTEKNNDEPSDAEYDQMAKDAEQDNLMRKAAELGYLDLEEGDTYEKMAAKGKKRGNLKQGTVRRRLKIKDGEKIPLSKINQAISRIKKMENPSEKNKKFLKALNLAKTLKTTTNVNELKEFDKPEDIKFDVKSLNMLYTDFGKFYGFYVYSEPNLKGERNVLRSIDDANKFLKSKGVNIIMLPGYDEESLDKIATALKGQGIDAEYGDYMDVSENKDKDDYGRSVSGKDKRTFVDPKDLTPAARAKKLAGIKEEKSKEDQLKIARAAFKKAEMNGDIRGQELALAAIEMLKNTKQ
jgi:hypothetical protein